MITFSTTINRLDNLKLNYVTIPIEIIAQLNENELKPYLNHRVIITLNETESWQGGIVALHDGMGYITVSSARLKKLNLHLHDTVTVSLKKDTSELGIEFPEEFIEYIQQDEEARIRFEALKPSLKRYIVYYIIQVKSSEKRLERTHLLLSNLKLAQPGKEEFRFLLGKN